MLHRILVVAGAAAADPSAVRGAGRRRLVAVDLRRGGRRDPVPGPGGDGGRRRRWPALMLVIDAVAGRAAELGTGADADRADRVHGRLRRQRPAEHRAAAHPGAAGGRRGRRRTGADRPGPARHPRSLADRDRGQGGAGPPVARTATPAAAAAEIGDVEQLAREALADVRATASGYPRGVAGRRAGRGRRRCCGPRASAPSCRRPSTMSTPPTGRSSATWCGRRSPTSSGIPTPQTCTDHPRRATASRSVDDGSDVRDRRSRAIRAAG